jgi:hypothetical protein
MGIGIPGPEAIAKDLLAHANSLSQIAIQSYYMPILGGVQDLFRNELDNRSTIDFGGSRGYGAADGRTQQEDDEDREDSDYVDHLQHPGNTKKRKVPTNASTSPHGRDVGSGQSGGEDEPTERSILTGRPDHEPEEIPQPATAAGLLGQRKGKITATTLAGLQHKEMLKNRKRQLAAVLGALTHGDTLALDQALSANFPFVAAGLGDLRGSGPPKVRLSRRPLPRRARAVRILRKSALARHPDAVAFPGCEFTFVCASASE